MLFVSNNLDRRDTNVFDIFFLLVFFNPKYGIFSIAFFFIRPTYFPM